MSAGLRTRGYRLATRLPDRARRLVPERVLASGPLRLSGGLGRGVLLDPPALTHIQLYELVRGVLETPVQEALRRHVGPGSVVYDVGANLGFFALLAAHLGARVEAFEPVPESAASIRRSAAHNGFRDLRVHETAVGARAGTATFLRVRERSWSHLADRGRHRDTQDELEVQVVALDDLALPAPDFVKVDVEGSEAAVLDGARGLLSGARPVLVVETHETNAEVADRLEGLGYRLQNLDGPGPVRAAGPVHVLAVPGVTRDPGA